MDGAGHIMNTEMGHAGACQHAQQKCPNEPNYGPSQSFHLRRFNLLTRVALRCPNTRGKPMKRIRQTYLCFAVACIAVLLGIGVRGEVPLLDGGNEPTTQRAPGFASPSEPVVERSST